MTRDGCALCGPLTTGCEDCIKYYETDLAVVDLLKFLEGMDCLRISRKFELDDQPDCRFHYKRRSRVATMGGKKKDTA